MIGLGSCRKNQQIFTGIGCGIDGIVETDDNFYSSANAIKIVLQSTTDESILYTAITDNSGMFSIRDIKDDTYFIDAVKEGYRWIWMIENNKPMGNKKIIELKDGEIKNLRIIMNNENPSILNHFPLELTDIYGNQISGSISIPRNTKTITFKLFNKSSKEHIWIVENTQYIFSSFTATTGTLSPGESITLVGVLQNEILYNELRFWCNGATKTVSLYYDY